MLNYRNGYKRVESFCFLQNFQNYQNVENCFEALVAETAVFVSPHGTMSCVKRMYKSCMLYFLGFLIFFNETCRQFLCLY